MVLSDAEMKFMRPRIEQRATACRHKLEIERLATPEHWRVAMTSTGRTKAICFPSGDHTGCEAPSFANVS